MLANTLTVGGKLLTRIREGEYSSEYRYLSGTEEWRLHIRHANTKPTLAGMQRDRHNVELIIKIFPTVEKPEGEELKTYLVAEQNSNNQNLTATFALLAFLTANENAVLTAIHVWDS